MKRTCVQCGTEFELTKSEMDFYRRKKLAFPKRCKECREQNRKKSQGSGAQGADTSKGAGPRWDAGRVSDTSRENGAKTGRTPQADYGRHKKNSQAEQERDRKYLQTEQERDRKYPQTDDEGNRKNLQADSDKGKKYPQAGAGEERTGRDPQTDQENGRMTFDSGEPVSGSGNSGEGIFTRLLAAVKRWFH